ncbi:hypothetical protein PUN28_018147 [Cardiocondyla obscurior]|uniref:Uncharacterized protein n=1 Tax=Cardiocondyla obscurior TaxID=286306 RepID=A0AAW2EID0_9HYME
MVGLSSSIHADVSRVFYLRIISFSAYVAQPLYTCTPARIVYHGALFRVFACKNARVISLTVSRDERSGSGSVITAAFAWATRNAMEININGATAAVGYARHRGVNFVDRYRWVLLKLDLCSITVILRPPRSRSL